MRIRQIAWAILICLSGCAQLPKDISVVQDFEVERYLGSWHEIARLDHWFERGLTDVTAEYSTNTDGTIRVVNRGYSSAKASWKEAVGKAKFVGEPEVGRLKVSFFGPFYGGYNIVDLDRDAYSYALVCGNNRSYLWILARQPSLPPATLQGLLAKADAFGFSTNALIFVSHERSTNADVHGDAEATHNIPGALETVVRAFAKSRPDNDVLFLSLANPDWEPLNTFVQRFDEDSLKVRPISQAKITGPWAVDKDTGERGVVLYINAVTVEEPGLLMVECGWHEGFGEDAPPHSDDCRYALRAEGSGWVVHHTSPGPH